MRQSEIKTIGFSDTFVLSVPLSVKEDEPEGIARAVKTVWAVLAGTAMVSLYAMAEGIPLRGGITVGAAVDVFPNEAYGAALIDAHRLENTMAQYNRVVVGPDLFAYLHDIRRRPANDAFVRGAQQMAEECYGLMCFAPDDELPMVHAWSTVVAALVADTGTWADFQGPAYEWVKSQVLAFGVAKDYKHWGRYVRLLRYVEACQKGTIVAIRPSKLSSV